MKNETAGAKKEEGKAESGAALFGGAKVPVAQHAGKFSPAGSRHHIHHCAYCGCALVSTHAICSYDFDLCPECHEKLKKSGAVLNRRKVSSRNRKVLERNEKNSPKEGTNMKTLTEVRYQKKVPIHFNFRESEIGAILVNLSKEKIQTKMVAWSLVVMFSLLQIVPAGWAATQAVPVNELPGQSVSSTVDALANSPSSTQSTPVSQQVVGFVDSTAFLLNASPLSPTTEADASVSASATDSKVQAAVSPLPSVIEPDTAISPTQINLPVSGYVLKSSSPNPVTTVTVKSNGISINYTGGAFAYSASGGISYDNPSTTGTVESVDLSALPALVFGLQGFVHVGTSSDSVRFTVKDASGATVSILLTGVQKDKETIQTVSKTQLAGVDLSHIVSASFSVDGYNVAGTWLNVRASDPGAVPPAVEAYTDALAKSLGAGFTVTTTLQKDGTCLVKVGVVNTCPAGAYCVAPMPGTFGSLQFSISRDGAVNRDSFKVHYNGIEADGKLLFSALMQLPYMDGRLPEMPEDPTEPTRLALVQMTKVTVTSVDSKGAISFTLGSVDYKAYRDASGKVIIVKALPPVVQGYVDALKKGLGVGFSVTATRQKDGTYLVNVADAKDYCQGPGCKSPSGLQSLSFVLSAAGVLKKDSLKATYYSSSNGNIKVDAKLLFDGMKKLLEEPNCQGDVCWVHAASDQEALTAMSRVTVTSVDSQGAIHFTRDSVTYSVRWNPDGTVDLKTVVPPAVQGYVDELKKGLGTGFSVTATRQKDGTYLITVADAMMYVLIYPPVKRSGLQSLSFVLSAVGVLQKDSLKATYYSSSNGDIGVAAKLLFDGMKKLLEEPNCQGDVCWVHAASDQEALTAMSRVIVTSVDSQGAIHFTRDSVTYSVRRNPDGTVKLEKEIVLPPAVQAYVKELQEKVGKGFEVTATLQKDGTYLISIADAKNYIQLPTSGLAKLSFRLLGLDKCSTGEKCSVAGFVIDPKSLRVQYYSKVAVDAGLLYEGLLQLQNYCAPGMMCPMVYRSDPKQAIVDMTRIMLISADKGGIQFTLGNKSYMAYRDASGKVILEETLPPAVQAYVDALKKGLGAGFSVTATLQKDGTYLVQVGRSNPCSGPDGLKCLQVAAAPGTFLSLVFNLSRDGIVNQASIKAGYAGTQVDGKLLFSALMQLPYMDGRLPEMPEDPTEPTRLALVQMTQVAVTSVDSKGAISFTLGSVDYKAYWDANGKVILEKVLPSAVQAYIDTLKSALGTGFSVTATLQKDGTYLVQVGRFNPCSGPDGLKCLQVAAAPGTFGSLQFSISRDGIVNRDSAKANYNGVGVDGKLLFDVMGALENSFHPANSEWMPPPQMYIARLVQLASQITISQAASSSLRFSYGGKSYQAVRDASGRIMLEILPPPAVQAYVDALKSTLGTGYIVAAIPQKDGGYLMYVERNTAKIIGSLSGSFQSLAFYISQAGVVNVDSLTANYNGVKIVGRLLYNAMEALEASFHPAGLKRMMAPESYLARLMQLAGQIQVQSASIVALQFVFNGKVYRAYWDIKGSVKRFVLAIQAWNK